MNQFMRRPMMNSIVSFLLLLLLTAFPYSRGSENTTGHPRASEVIGGNPADIKEFPFLVSLHYHAGGHQNAHMCCGFLLTPSWIGTAAHCLLSKKGQDVVRTSEVLPPVYFYVLASTADVVNRDNHYQKRDAESFIPHPRFSWSLLYNDIGLIRVSRPFDYNGHISLAILPGSDLNFKLDPWMACSVAGWGITDKDDHESISDRLMSVTLNIMPQEDCELGIGGSFFMNPAGSICTYSDTGSKDTCKGDSGSALVCTLPEAKGEVLLPELASDWVKSGWQVDKERNNIVVGIVSWSWECASAGIPAMHTEILNYRDWMEFTVLNYNASGKSHPVILITLASILIHIVLK